MKLDCIFAPLIVVVVVVFVKQSKKNHFLYISSDVIDGLTSLQLNKKYRKWMTAFS